MFFISVSLCLKGAKLKLESVRAQCRARQSNIDGHIDRQPSTQDGPSLRPRPPTGRPPVLSQTKQQPELPTVAADAVFGRGGLLAYRAGRNSGTIGCYGREQSNHGRVIFGIPKMPYESASHSDR